ncbi:MAG: DUF6339 family protein [Verrucomicrobiales bacterium]|nr:DUF6339 family protein [Verrucomicrobiales bacterium]
MPIQTILPNTQLADMRHRVESESTAMQIYMNSDQYPLPADNRMLNTLIEIPAHPPELLVGNDRAVEDAENAIKIFEYLGPLNRTQAADPRLWATLSHITFWEYCRKRWPEANKGSGYILEHWFERPGGGLGALRRNAISRLWWAANLTVAPWDSDLQLSHLKSSDRFKFTRILLSQAQIFQDVLEREYGSNLRLRTILLNSLHAYMPKVSNRDKLSKVISMRLLLLLKERHLESLPPLEMEKLVDTLVARAAEQQNTA